MPDNERTIEQQLEDESLGIEAENADDDFDESPDLNEPGLEGPSELVAGEGVSLEQVLDTIFDILYTHSTQIGALTEYLFNQNTATVPEAPKLTVVGDVD